MTTRPHVIIMDLDNCLADDRWRRGTIDPDPRNRDRYHRYHLLSRFDAVGNRHLVDRTPHEVVICTGRPDAYRDLTVLWLNKQQIAHVALLMRSEKDYRPAAQVKVELVQRYLIQTNRTIVKAYDDRVDVIEAYRLMGLPAERVFIHLEHIPTGV